ncbi:MAG: YceI family protein [Acidimicrobiia bacterium]
MTVSAAQDRTFEGQRVPPVGRWNVDPSHSSLQFVARHMMISKVRGRFRKFEGTIVIAEDPLESSVEATIDTSTIDTGDPDRDTHLRAAEFLDVERFPHARFTSTSLSPGNDGKWQIKGDLTIRDVTRVVELTVEFCGVADDPWGNVRAGFLGTTEINREEFDITWNQALEAGGFLVGKGVKVEVDVEALLESDEK